MLMNEAVFFKFHQKSRQERLALLLASGMLDAEDIAILEGAVDPAISDQAEHFIENLIGCFPLPLGVVPNCFIDGIRRIIPLAVEETSIIAGLSKTAKWIHRLGKITTHRKGNCIIGQVQCHRIIDTNAFTKRFLQYKAAWINAVNNNVMASLVKRGGGLLDIQLRFVPDKKGGTMAVLLKPLIQKATGSHVGLCIVSNLTDTQLSEAVIRLDGVGELEGHAIAEAADFAWQDPYRACTHNKGVLNGIDPLLIATGNDWRAVEAGIHAYACRDGQYRSITTWEYNQGSLIGRFKAPIVVGTVGGVTTLHPIAKIGIKLLGIQHAEELSRICAAVGLMQNLAALRALATQGIVSGHMKLHIENLILAAGAKSQEVAPLREKMRERLAFCNKVTMSDAVELLALLRAHQSCPA